MGWIQAGGIGLSTWVVMSLLRAVYLYLRHPVRVRSSEGGIHTESVCCGLPTVGMPVSIGMMYRWSDSCPYCDKQAPSWKVAMEVGTVIAWSLIAKNVDLSLAPYLFFLVWACGMVVVYDVEQMRIPNMLNAAIALVGIGLAAYTKGLPGVENAAAGALMGMSIPLAVYTIHKLRTGKEGLGMGDVKLLGAVGVWVGAGDVLDVMVLACLLAILGWINAKGYKPEAINRRMPFGPYIATATIAVLVLNLF